MTTDTPQNWEEMVAFVGGANRTVDPPAEIDIEVLTALIVAGLNGDDDYDEFRSVVARTLAGWLADRETVLDEALAIADVGAYRIFLNEGEVSMLRARTVLGRVRKLLSLGS